MKTAVSLPDELFRKAEEMAQRLGIPRSQLYARALSDYVAAHSRDHVTAALNDVYAEEASSLDPALTAGQEAALPDEEW